MKEALVFIGSAVLLVLILSATIFKTTDQAVEPQKTAAPTVTPTPAPALPIEIIDGEIWVAIPVEGMEEYYADQD